MIEKEDLKNSDEEGSDEDIEGLGDAGKFFLSSSTNSISPDY